jgi:hypothetical protein
MPSLTLTGTSDIILYGQNSQHAVSCPGAPWNAPCDLATSGVVASMEQKSGLATIAQSPTGTQAAAGIAVKLYGAGHRPLAF